MFLSSVHLWIFYSKEKQGQFDPGATQEQYYTLSIQPFFFLFRHYFVYYFSLQWESFLQVPPIKRFTVQTFYKLLHTFWHHQHFLITLKTFVLNWCRISMLFCNMCVICFSLACWISLLIMASNFCWRLNSKEFHNDFKYIYFSRVYFNISRDILILTGRRPDLHISLNDWNVWIHK